MSVERAARLLAILAVVAGAIMGDVWMALNLF